MSLTAHNKHTQDEPFIESIKNKNKIKKQLLDRSVPIKLPTNNEEARNLQSLWGANSRFLKHKIKHNKA